MNDDIEDNRPVDAIAEDARERSQLARILLDDAKQILSALQHPLNVIAFPMSSPIKYDSIAQRGHRSGLR